MLTIQIREVGVRTAFADGDEAFTGGWEQARFDSEFNSITRQLGAIGYIGFNPLYSPTRRQAELQHPANYRRVPQVPLPPIDFVNDPELEP